MVCESSDKLAGILSKLQALKEVDGVKEVKLYKDGTLLKTCVGAAPCTVTTGPWTTTGTLTFNATALDLLDVTSTAMTTVTVH